MRSGARPAFIAIIAVLLSSLATAGEQTADFYVATDGNDAWSGRHPEPNEARTDGPLATLGRARDAIRRAKSRGPVVVMVRGGTYRLTEPFVLRAEDSGTEGCPITYAAYPGETPRLSGGREVTGWRPAHGNLWQTEIPEARAGKWVFRQLFVDGQLRRRPRLPKEGECPIVGAINPKKWKAPENASGFRYRPGDIDGSWTNLGDVEVVVLQHWMEARLPIAKVDDATHTVTLRGSSWRPLTWSTGYLVENVREALGEPGEWYLDWRTGVLTYWPMPGEDMTKAEVIAPAVEQLVRLEGNVDEARFVEYVTFRGLTFCHTTAPLAEKGHAYSQAEMPVPAAIYAEGSRHCRFDGNEIAHVGQWGIELSRGCQDNHIVGNRIHDVGAGGIKIGESREPETDADEACRTVVTDNHVCDGNRVYMGAPGIWIGRSGSNLVAHNEVRGAWQWGISVGWQWQYLPPTRGRDNRVEYNHIHHLGESELGTHGAIYCLGLSPGTVVRNNHVHHISGGGYGIILDQGSCGVLVENNVVHHTCGGFSSNFHCIGNIAMNNVFALTTLCGMHRYGDNPPPGYSLANTNIFCRNILYWREGKLLRRDDWLDFATVQDYNLYFDATGDPVKFGKRTFGEWKAKKLDLRSIVADPLFMKPDRGDFRLRTESPAFKLRFRPIDLSRVGPRLGQHPEAE